MDPTPPPPSSHSFHRQQVSMIPPTQQLDEGYSEGIDTRSQSDSDGMIYTPLDDSPSARFQESLQALLALPVEQRKMSCKALLQSLPIQDMLDAGKFIVQLTHFDPAHYLPPEIFLAICAYLAPKDLLSASVVSRAWRVRAQDEKLWKQCFAREGWVLDKGKVEEFEKEAEAKGRQKEGVVERGGQEDEGLGLERRESRKRRRGEAFCDGEAGTLAEGAGQVAQSSAGVEVVESGHEEAAGDNMDGVEVASMADTDGTARATVATTVPDTNVSTNDDTLGDIDRRYSFDAINYPEIPSPKSSADFTLAPSLFQQDSHKLSWPYLYKQRRRLEGNWERGHYKMFQLPHPDHTDEGHAECVYTIQHTAQHLVSGSRDRTIRIWDLDTCRLKTAPLRGHEASVLCLQFDERPSQDIIVSGGSDAFVIIWRFSTGEILKKLTNAHEESVLNLRFDDRYIVTCSKDKTIKLWNRTALSRDSDLIPSIVLRSFADPTAGLGGTGDMIEEYTHLSTLRGHHAAVNAVMIHDSTIVSASGDRTIKAWDLHTGNVKKNYINHTKGIACVQFDGRRVVSGSSDNTVRIFDAENQAEVACLTGHSNLVRTVQARFGDLVTTSSEELEQEAQAADRGFYRALEQGMQPASVSRRTARNAGSSRPEEMLALGARVPPGGGGSRWAKIVSGSYDESVILWKRDADGKWVERLRLHQGLLINRRRQRAIPPLPALPPALPPLPAVNLAAGGVGQQPQQHQHIAQNLHTAQQNAQNVLATAQGHLAQLQQMHHQPQGGGGAGQLGQIGALQAQLAQVSGMLLQQQQQQQQQNNMPQPNLPPPLPQPQAQLHQQAVANNHPPPLPPAAAAAGVGGMAAHNANNIAAAAAARGESMRVFKLQFDARRIICCSQNKVIVGWDFANGEKELELVGGWSLETA